MWNLVSICLFEVIFEFPVWVTVTSKLKAIKMVLILAQWEFLEDSQFTWICTCSKLPILVLNSVFPGTTSILGHSEPCKAQMLLLSKGVSSFLLERSHFGCFSVQRLIKYLNSNGKTRSIKEDGEWWFKNVTNKGWVVRGSERNSNYKMEGKNWMYHILKDL